MIALVAVTGLMGCKKYDDGPMFSLRSREERISNTWRIDRAMNGSDDVTSAFDQYELRLTKAHDASLTATYTLFGTDFSFTTSGTWSFENKDEDLRLDFEDSDADETYQILRLKETELWLREKGGDLELQLVPI
ncbi:MAG: DUF5004 domain-containing protein [Flavobacteriales bacterium]|nr:DUF5004 domain-containing protein [Flavobacteriales bacterium]